MTRLLAAFAAAITFCLPAQGQTSYYSDLWWNPDENGWGVGLQQQGYVLFVTLFVYGADGRNTWFVAPDVRPDDASPSVWRGALYRATGPGFATQFDASVQATATGDVAMIFDSASTGTLSYTIDGTRVTKRISRMTWREPSAAGTYHGGFSALVGQCIDVTRVGPYDFLGAMSVTQSGRQVSASIVSGVNGANSTCNFTGNATYSGRVASWSGTFACNVFIGLDGRGENVVNVSRRGNFTVRDLAITSNGIHGLIVAADQDCAFSGYFGGTRLP